MLEHLTDEALRAEAERRRVAVTPEMDRAAIIEAIRRSAASLPPGAQGKRSTFGTARAMLGRVVDLARGALERKEPSSEERGADEPIRTRTMAELLIDQGEVARGAAILRELAMDHPDDEDLARRCRELAAQVAQARAREHLDASEGPFVELLAEGETRAVAWAIDEAGRARARAVLGDDGELTLRAVRIAPDADGKVAPEQEDRSIEPRGTQLLGAGEATRWVVSVGLRRGDRFVSIAHARG